MNYNEFTNYLADQILGVRNLELKRALTRRSGRYYDAAYNSVLECRAFFDRFSLDEGSHNDYNPSSRTSVEAYRVEMYVQIAKALAQRAAEVCTQGDEYFLNEVLVHGVRYGEYITDGKFSRVAAGHLSNIVFERTCAGCGAKYDVVVKGQTYRMISNNHPPTCATVRTAPVQVAAIKQVASPVQTMNPEAELTEQQTCAAIKRARMFMQRSESQAPDLKPTKLVIPDEMLKPTLKHAYNSPDYRSEVKKSLRLYAAFFDLYAQNPLPDSDPEENHRQMERAYNLVLKTVFNFDRAVNKNKQQ